MGTTASPGTVTYSAHRPSAVVVTPDWRTSGSRRVSARSISFPGGSGSDGSPGRWVRTGFIGQSSGANLLPSANQPGPALSTRSDRPDAEPGARRRQVARGSRQPVSGEQQG